MSQESEVREGMETEKGRVGEGEQNLSPSPRFPDSPVRIFILLLAYCLLLTGLSFAEDKFAIDSNQPITITSNNMEARKKENLVIFKGE